MWDQQQGRRLVHVQRVVGSIVGRCCYCFISATPENRSLCCPVVAAIVHHPPYFFHLQGVDEVAAQPAKSESIFEKFSKQEADARDRPTDSNKSDAPLLQRLPGCSKLLWVAAAPAANHQIIFIDFYGSTTDR